MKYVKLFALAAVAAMAFMAVVGASSASAKEGVLCSTATDPCTSKWAVGTVLEFSQEDSAKLVDTSGNTLDTCTGSHGKGVLEANPNATGTATGNNTEAVLSGCSFTTDIIAPGKAKIEAEDNSGNGIVYSDSRIEVTIVIFGTSCIYGAEPGTTGGTLKEGKKEPGTNVGAPTFTTNAIASKLSGSILCPSTAKLTGTGVLTTPTNTTLWVSHK